MDLDNSGTIDFTEFVAGCLVEKQVGEAALHTAFDRLDQTRYVLLYHAKLIFFLRLYVLAAVFPVGWDHWHHPCYGNECCEDPPSCTPDRSIV